MVVGDGKQRDFIDLDVRWKLGDRGAGHREWVCPSETHVGLSS